MTVMAVVAEAATQLRLRPGRSTSSVLLGAVAVGAFVFLATVLAQSRFAVDAVFQQRRPRLVWLTSREGDVSVADDPALADDAVSRVLALPEVVRGGRFWIHRAATVRRSRVDSGRVIPVVAADPAAAEAVGAHLSRGRWPGPGPLPQVAVTRPALRRLGSTSGVPLPLTLIVDDQEFAVVGVVEPAGDRPEFTGVLYVDPAVAMSRLGADEGVAGGYVLEAEPDDLVRVATAAPLAARPDDPGAVSALVPPDPTRLRDLVDDRVRVVVLGVGIVAAVLGTASVAVNSWTSVAERRLELAARLALGATGSRLAAEVLTEAALVGLTAGLIGAGSGLAAAAVFGVVHDWPQAYIPWSTPAAVGAGVVAGVVAGLAPARATSAVDPAAVLRSP